LDVPPLSNTPPLTLAVTETPGDSPLTLLPLLSKTGSDTTFEFNCCPLKELGLNLKLFTVLSSVTFTLTVSEI
jgi:hypothetical protein